MGSSTRRPDEAVTRESDDAVSRDERPTVVLAHSHLPAGHDIREVLEWNGFLVTAEADTATELVEAVLNRSPRLCLLDVDLTGGSSQAIRAILVGRPDTKIVVLAHRKNRHRVRLAISAGADGALLAAATPEDVVTFLSAVLGGRPPSREEGTSSVDEELQSLARPGEAALVRTAVRDQGRPRPSPLAAARWLLFVLLYVPRFARHFHRRLRSRMLPAQAWASARRRMRTYR